MAFSCRFRFRETPYWPFRFRNSLWNSGSTRFFYKHHHYKHHQPIIWPKNKHHPSTSPSLTSIFTYNFSTQWFVFFQLRTEMIALLEVVISFCTIRQEGPEIIHSLLWKIWKDTNHCVEQLYVKIEVRLGLVLGWCLLFCPFSIWRCL